MKIVYIAHPIGGDVKGNIDKIVAIVRHINLAEPEILPFAPYVVDCLALDDSDEMERGRGIKNGLRLLKAGFINEVWLYGSNISSGMGYEIATAIEMGIKIVSMSKGTSSFKYTEK